RADPKLFSCNPSTIIFPVSQWRWVMRMDYKSDPSGGPIQTMLDTAFGGLIAGGRSFEPWFRAATRSNLEAYSLMSRRTLAYLELPMRLSQCRSPQDFASEQMRFWQDMFRQYAECGQK